MPSHLVKKPFCFGHVIRPLTLYAILVLSGFSLVTLFVSLVSPNWLITWEKISVVNGSVVYLETSSGLWTKCSHEDTRPEETLNCSRINYFIRAEKDGLGPTDSILLSLRKAVVFPMMCFMILIVGQGVSIFAVTTFNADNSNQKIFIVIGTLHIIAGLFLFIGLIIYIGAITDEAMDRSKVDPTEDHPPFLFKYGPSFPLVVLTFFCGELTGVLAIQFYFSLNRSKSKSKSKNGESDEIEIELTNRETSSKSNHSVRFQMLAKLPSSHKLTTNAGPENLAKRNSIPLYREEHKATFLGGCVNKLGVKSKKPTKVDRVSERLSSPMFDAKMPKIQHRFKSIKISINQELIDHKIISNNGLYLNDARNNKQHSILDHQSVPYVEGVDHNLLSRQGNNLRLVKTGTRESGNVDRMFIGHDFNNRGGFTYGAPVAANERMIIKDFECKRLHKNDNNDTALNYITDYIHPPNDYFGKVHASIVTNVHCMDNVSNRNPIEKLKLFDNSLNYSLNETHNVYPKTLLPSHRIQPNLIDKSTIDFKNKNTPV